MKIEGENINSLTKSISMEQARELILPFDQYRDCSLGSFMRFTSLRNRLTTRVVRNFLESGEIDRLEPGFLQKKRGEVRIYMIDQSARDIFSKLGGFLFDLTSLSSSFILPETEDEISCLMTMAARAITTGRPITLCTPICPDWSRDSLGRYDFRSLGGGESFIAKKFFDHASELLEVFTRHEVPFRGVLLFADWGLETEIDAKDTFGRKLSPEDVQMCFQATFARTDEHLLDLQKNEKVGRFFSDYEVVSMKRFLTERLDVPQVQRRLTDFFKGDKKGRRLHDALSDQSYSVNRFRLGVGEQENKEFALRNLVEYATVGQALDNHSIFIVCESRTSSRSYNLPRDRQANIPIFFLKGKQSLDSGVNIL